MNKFHITVLGADESQVIDEIKTVATSLACEAYDVEKIMEPFQPTPDVILCYSASCDMSPLEIAQTLRSNYPGLPIFFITSDQKDFDKKKLIKNGFTQAFLLPWEKADLIRKMREESIYSARPELKDYKAVKVVDLIPGSVLDFSLKILMPLNNKFVFFSQEGSPVDQEKLNRLAENSLNTLYIHKDDLQKFRDYTTEMFKKNLRDSELSHTEKQEKLDGCIRELISDMFIQDIKENTFGKSQALLQEVKKVIDLLLSEGNKDLMAKIGLLVNQEGNFYFHLTNVSTYAGVFAMILKFENPQHLALAGLLHDIGKINLPVELADLEESEMGPKAREAYRNHPQYSLDVVKLKRIALPEPVTKAILQHHETMNGTGYPKGIDGSRISKEARLLAIADAFDELTTLKYGHKALSPRDALGQMLQDNSQDPGRMLLDFEMLKQLKHNLIG